MRDKTPQEWAREFERKRGLYDDFTNKIAELTRDLLREYEYRENEDYNLESRTKSVKSFSEKIIRPDKQYDDPLAEVTDLSGVRVVVYYLEDVDGIGEMIRKEFTVDDKNSVDKSAGRDPDRFGYQSDHYVVSLSDSRAEDTVNRRFKDLKAEMQVRTVLQHAWAVIDHKIRYKSPGKADFLARQLFCLSALLELADQEFSRLKRRWDEQVRRYSEDVKKGDLDIAIDLASVDAYLETSAKHLDWMKVACEAGFREYEDPSPAVDDWARTWLIKTLQQGEIKTIRELDTLLEEAAAWGRAFLKEVFNLSSEKGFAPDALPQAVLSLLVIRGRRKRFRKALIRKAELRKQLVDAIVQAAQIS